jgi:hypothetical protein
LFIPIRVYGIDFQGKDFVEDATTLVVSWHGAKLRMIHQLLPEQEIRLLSRPTCQEGLFRVVSKVTGTDGQHTFWGVECLDPERSIWGIRFPALEAADQASVRITIECPGCHTRELLFLDEHVLECIQSKDGVARSCLSCKTSGWWQLVAYSEA